MDTYVLAGTEYIHWNWTNLVERLECFDLIPEILLGEEMTSKIETNSQELKLFLEFVRKF